MGRIRSFYSGKKHEEISIISSYLFCVWKDGSTKTRIQIPARQYCGPLRIRRQRWAYRKVLQPPWTCRPGMRAHAARDGIRVFIWLSCFLRICRIRSDFPGKIGEENQEPVQGFMASFLSKLHSGRNIRDIHDRWDRESFHGVSGFPSPYIYIA